jgi:hypothetical protein
MRQGYFVCFDWVSLLARLRGRRHGAELQPVWAALEAVGAGGIEAQLVDAPRAWEELRRRGAACACVLESELRHGERGELDWPLLLRFSPGSEFAHISEWRPRAERIVVGLEWADFDARWRGGRSDVIELFPRPRPTIT